MVIKQGDKQIELEIIPEDWTIETMEDIADIIMGQSPLGDSYNSRNGTPLLNGPSEFGTIHPQPIQFTTKPTKFSKIDDILLCVRGSTTGRLNLSNQEYCIGRGLASIRGKTNKTDTRWLFYYFKKLQKYIIHISSGGGSTFPNINKDLIKKILLPCPTFTEQQEISKALLHCDELIINTTNLIEKKKNIKLGTMQELLTGKRKLGEFSGEWETKELEKILEIKKGQLITENTSVDGNIPVIGAGKRSSYYHNQPNRFKKTITISASGANAGYVSFHKCPIFASDCSTIEEGKNYSIEYIYFQLKLLQSKIYTLQAGGGQPHVHASDLLPLKIQIPKDKKEQIAIAEIISNIQKEIKELEKEKDKYFEIKIGMMQKLLTGEIRLV